MNIRKKQNVAVCKKNITIADIIRIAKESAENSYAPYSGHKVGAAVATDSGIFSGSNVENRSYGLTVCAERSAVFSAVSCGAKRIEIIAVHCGTFIPVPCGACLQVLSEFSDDDLKIAVSSGNKTSGSKTKTYTLGELMPKRFTV